MTDGDGESQGFHSFQNPNGLGSANLLSFNGRFTR